MGTQAKRQQKADSRQQRERLAQNIAGRITTTQGRLANRLNRVAAKTTRRQQILFFTVLILLLGGCFGYLILSNIR
ncbi:hypothetical protein GCM10011386_26990 [Parapedobacter defluvii]|uniref:Uncharacterized protein n=1 Tax=Parapedobacter defluvii TaxID=2045106 RepID=A0ABQ1M269_9SPHI|nr:hypothetical protein [Parapedobacter defluvii]GGC33484.1 hypothetical protein GCM10011386_26990 [Parapedobacter defluvii]